MAAATAEERCSVGQQVPRWYQQAAVQRTIETNTILALETGQGKVSSLPAGFRSWRCVFWLHHLPPRSLYPASTFL